MAIPQYNDLDIKEDKDKLTNAFQSLVGKDFDISNQ